MNYFLFGVTNPPNKLSIPIVNSKIGAPVVCIPTLLPFMVVTVAASACGITLSVKGFITPPLNHWRAKLMGFLQGTIIRGFLQLLK
jgi:hypothetical protein